MTDVTALPRISLLLPTMRRREHFRVALESVLRDAKEYPNLEIIVIDGATGDESVVDIVQEYSNAIAWYGPGEGRGLYGALNTGLKHATGDYVRMVSDDDGYVSGVMRLYGEYMLQHPEYVAVGGTAVFTVTDGDGNAVTRTDFGTRTGEITMATYAQSASFVECIHEALYIRRDALLRIGGWSEMFTVSGDIDMLFRLLRGGRSIMILPHVLVEARRTNRSLSCRLPIRAMLEPLISLIIRGYWHIAAVRIVRHMRSVMRIGSR